MKKEAIKKSIVCDNNFGILSVTMGILSILISTTPLSGFLFGVLGIIFSNKQKNKSNNSWASSGMILSIIGLVINILFIILLTYMLKYPEITNGLFNK